MRTLTLFAALLVILAGCKSQKHTVACQSATTDSLAHSESHRTILQTDCIAARFDFDFDTLNVTIERQVADVPVIDGVALPCKELVKLKAVGGKIIRSKEQNKLAAAHEERLDTLAYKLASSDNSMEHTATTAVYNPPSATIIVLASLLILCGAAYFFFRRKL